LSVDYYEIMYVAEIQGKNKEDGLMGYYTFLTAKPRSEWLKQVKEGMEYAKKYKNLDEFAEKDKENCAKMLQAFDALGANVDQKLAVKCGLTRYVKRLEDVVW